MKGLTSNKDHIAVVFGLDIDIDLFVITELTIKNLFSYGKLLNLYHLDLRKYWRCFFDL